jgi:hypothetical protein
VVGLLCYIVLSLLNLLLLLCEENSIKIFAGKLIRHDQTILKVPAVLRIRDVYPGSEFFPSLIQGQKDSRIRIRISIKGFKYFNPKNGF